MNWDKFERSKKYFLIPLASWWGFGLLAIFSTHNGFIVGVPLIIGGIFITRKHYKKYKRLIQGDNK